MIINIEHVIKRSRFTRFEEIPRLLEENFNNRMLRWFISRVTDEDVFVEITLSEEEKYPFPRDDTRVVHPGKSVVVSIIPTGVGCEIGGYAADAAPATALLASCTDYLVTNPNAVNASNFIHMDKNVWYTEGYMIDQFCKGLLNLYKPYSNKVGLIVESASNRELDVIFNVVNTARAVYGVHLEDIVITDEKVGGRCEQNKSGSYVGMLKDPAVLFGACERLIEKGVNAIAVTTNIQDLPTDNYAKHFEGLHPNPVGGAEAILSHLIGAKYKIPTAHAPLTNIKEMGLKTNVVDARGAGEFVSASGLACVLMGLANAPQVKTENGRRIEDVININNLMAVVAPAGALGGIPMLYAQTYNIPVIAVKDNKTILDVNREKLGLTNVIEVGTYAEAAGILQALRNGISIPSIHRPLPTLRYPGHEL
jgi:hypothetical protein